MMTEGERLQLKIGRLFHKALRDYRLIDDGDKVLVGLSGGKDSLTLLELLAKRSRVFMPRFEVEAAFVRMTNIPYQNDETYLHLSAASFSCHSRVSMGSSVVPIKATLAFSMMPRTVRLGSF